MSTSLDILAFGHEVRTVVKGAYVGGRQHRLPSKYQYHIFVHENESRRPDPYSVNDIPPVPRTRWVNNAQTPASLHRAVSALGPTYTSSPLGLSRAGSSDTLVVASEPARRASASSSSASSSYSSLSLLPRPPHRLYSKRPRSDLGGLGLGPPSASP
ncbi:hypothetical protein DL96DRAFT_1711767 [Flagelloscypha sp. PMI_526]|nr:hypothetical protein DL96DRAFT_1711767 [Flagelloscypha sp. PMI_526]